MKTTQLGYPVVSDKTYNKIFGSGKRPEMKPDQLNKAKDLLKEFGIETPVNYPDGLFSGELPLPDLKSSNLKEHFESIAEAQIGQFEAMANSYAKCKLPPIPDADNLVFESGWVRYEWVNKDQKWDIQHVDKPLEEAFTFDTETFVQGGAFPIIGTALSEKAAYIWIAKELIDPTLPKDEWDQYGFIPIGTDRFVIGHNISYDRVRARESYDLARSGPENFYFDTLSAHIAVSGLASGQRWLYTLSTKDPDALSYKEQRILKTAPDWLEKGSTNSMVQVYNFHVYGARKFFSGPELKPLGEADKKVRDIFVKASSMLEITPYLKQAVDYAIKDAFYTAEIFQELWPKYINASPSKVALCGHYHLNGSIVPLVDDWKEWVEGTEKVYEEYNEEMTAICKKLLWECYDTWKSMDDESERDKWVRDDPWLKQLDWEVKSEKGKYAGVPNWMRPFIKDPDEKVGVKSRLAHLLLKLKWEGQPLTWIEGQGWCYWSEDDEDDDKDSSDSIDESLF
jgi:DNA polymerase gamma 1